MALVNVTEEIKKQAELQAEEIVSEAKTHVKEIKENVKKDVAAYKTQAKEHATQLATVMERRMIAQATFDAQRDVMNAKKELVDEVVNVVTKEITSMKKTEAQKFLATLLTNAKKEIDVHTVYVAKGQKALVKGVKQVKEDLTLRGGLIAENKDGTVSVDYSLTQLVENARQHKIVEVSEVLFGDE